ncbi:adenylyltransferase/sulfurtransferase [Antricoccus suffuscus]|uniref:Adenylyltransferase/sulfurtransferase n=1 Tax=Antricoccus suffuscus TaxID=1629062 RepID=A0A2T0ZQG0_9ACTN|nr:ThiF family adenylyltransferase [Antricoccus suffuscus]PRZ38555.1 adenylyltransferase/sulfurtransferase [Antricoccus suffuscus]
MSIGPIVDVGAELTAEQSLRYSRHLSLSEIGPDGQRRIANARVLCIGAGGLGAPALLYFAAAGVGTIGIVEYDDVDATNLQRQVIHGVADVGRSKAQSARDSILEINPDARVRLHEVRMDHTNAQQIFADYDLVLDGTDNFATRYLVNDACVLAGKPYVWGSILGFRGQLSVFWDAAPGGGRNYRDLFPTPPPPGSVPSCSEAGVLGAICGTMGSLMAVEALKLITGVGDVLLGRVLTFDAMTMAFRTLEFGKNSAAEAITSLRDYDEYCGVPATAQNDAITPTQLHELLHDETGLLLLDVREPFEAQIVQIPGSTLIPHTALLDGTRTVPAAKDDPIVVYCKSGGRSAKVADYLREHGFTHVDDLAGGVLAWVDDIEPAGQKY